ncbi:hypothetical protein SEMRO_1683_G290891.1 [Seminavis robusta]|uniref:Uncharacterized protein n=1 Tax=Seminavis robusta TaxID=568900 RepID=A0A9N8EQP8_9STRA|nr:hypothetical protein SEMRO_1683_G290891.1 [Seminavis robusta]|eukprot:Sro1683_g290891.1  (141) ;mRNA; r:1921-2343
MLRHYGILNHQVRAMRLRGYPKSHQPATRYRKLKFIQGSHPQIQKEITPQVAWISSVWMDFLSPVSPLVEALVASWMQFEVRTLRYSIVRVSAYACMIMKDLQTIPLPRNTVIPAVIRPQGKADQMKEKENLPGSRCFGQ